MRNKRLVKLTTTALMAAIIFVVTYIIRIPLPFASGGYLNIGDAPIYLGAYLLGGPLGALAAALGSSMSDLAAGYVFYAAPTAIIKGTMGFVCGSLMRGESLKRFALASALGGGIMTGGYAVFETLFFNANQALAAIPFNMIQWAGGALVAIALFPAVKAVGRTLNQR
jgi:uncharacterized membrane protein